ncbi:MAG: hypothetical protein HKN45_12195 [Flavobacteriales bacterium]|nr:hypothetical protein [Flavobacteriales bacterium]
MLRIGAIATLLFYITVSIGVSFDIDTCCQSIAGISLALESSENVPTSQSCCSSEKMACCSSEESTCSLDLIYVQILSEEQLISSSPKVDLSCIELFHLNSDAQSTDFLRANCTEQYVTHPPPIQREEDLHLWYRTLLTYG